MGEKKHSSAHVVSPHGHWPYLPRKKNPVTFVNFSIANDLILGLYLASFVDFPSLCSFLFRPFTRRDAPRPQRSCPWSMGLGPMAEARIDGHNLSAQSQRLTTREPPVPQPPDDEAVLWEKREERRWPGRGSSSPFLLRAER